MSVRFSRTNALFVPPSSRLDDVLRAGIQTEARKPPAKATAGGTVSWNPDFAKQLLRNNFDPSMPVRAQTIIEYSRALLLNIPYSTPTPEAPHALAPHPMLRRLRLALANEPVCKMAQTVLNSFSMGNPSAEDKRLIWMGMSPPAVPKSSTLFAETMELIVMLYWCKNFFQTRGDGLDPLRLRAWSGSNELAYFKAVSAYISVNILRKLEGYFLKDDFRQQVWMRMRDIAELARK